MKAGSSLGPISRMLKEDPETCNKSRTYGSREGKEISEDVMRRLRKGVFL